jgi:hypothetical protein
MRGSLEARFWAKVDKTPTCWLFTGSTAGEGYGWFWAGSCGHRAHRVAYELLVGPIPEGMTLDHVKDRGCTSKACVKALADEHGPAHLEPVTHRENILRGAGVTACNAAKTVCPHGHPYDAANTMHRRRSDGRAYRKCRQCDNRQRRARKRTRRQAHREGRPL